MFNNSTRSHGIGRVARIRKADSRLDSTQDAALSTCCPEIVTRRPLTPGNRPFAHGVARNPRYRFPGCVTRFRRMPTPSSSTSTTSPSTIRFVVPGVPVKITSPGISVTYRLM